MNDAIAASWSLSAPSMVRIFDLAHELHFVNCLYHRQRCTRPGRTLVPHSFYTHLEVVQKPSHSPHAIMKSSNEARSRPTTGRTGLTGYCKLWWQQVWAFVAPRQYYRLLVQAEADLPRQRGWRFIARLFAFIVLLYCCSVSRPEVANKTTNLRTRMASGARCRWATKRTLALSVPTQPIGLVRVPSIVPSADGT